MCSGSSNASSCDKIKNFPSTKSLISNVYSFCNSMNMDGCSSCHIISATQNTTTCDVLKTYSQLCQQMSTTQCVEYRTMCEATPKLPFCPQSQSTPDMPVIPPMLMYFHSGVPSYILFKGWVATNKFEYIASWLVCLIVAVFHEWLSITMHRKKEIYLNTLQNNVKLLLSGSMDDLIETSIPIPSLPPRVFGLHHGSDGFWVSMQLSGFRLLHSGLHFILMLIVMSFDVALFFAVIFGFAIGNAAFGSLDWRV